ncbi:transglycosylase SLT domain-containing protein [Acetobacter sp. LMG 1627]|uniref:Transglycosylase SLT domain-containing protein n=1 Tax=Acetobacter conturbans TaxID=1737472 RepID=A0ABX0K0A2_9PROT|nr:transglycosylase SLT domain-containing protein [Acetobacter conturbans]
MAVSAMVGLAACSSGGSRPGGSPSQWGRGDYTAPGPSSDPWGPYIREASSRFSVPEPWIRAVIHQESGGQEYQHGRLTRSGSGAMGLMQLMPATWSELAGEFSLGNDPYEPHDNIMAGTGYIHQLYGKFGSPGFLAAYNAGPGRLEQYLQTGDPLPDETVNYVASISPHLNDAVPGAVGGSAPIMVAQASTAVALVPAYETGYATAQAPVSGPVARTGDGCLRNVDAAYDPSNCLVDRDTPHADPAPTSLPPPQPAIQVASAAPAPVSTATSAPQEGLPHELASYVEPSSTRVAPRVMPAVYTTPAVTRPMVTRGGGWAVQVGAFSSGNDARIALAQAQAIIGNNGVNPVVAKASPAANALYRARLVGFAAQDATTACRILHSHSVACFAVPQST